ncbi:hypothetical protein NDU88_008352 [Pleurodeles waltl]|uniref:Uncharacterized protein n=1 Tax=Pleurodeles waltl TaxID=8319 RepID=A0AAV7RXE1_PLEWA|nr:hypothetical protein NDU88_008352 [Pleurodeles waltl]
MHATSLASSEAPRGGRRSFGVRRALLLEMPETLKPVPSGSEKAATGCEGLLGRGGAQEPRWVSHSTLRRSGRSSGFWAWANIDLLRTSQDCLDCLGGSYIGDGGFRQVLDILQVELSDGVGERTKL